MIYGGERKMELRRVNDIIADYPGEWVAVEVLEYDSRDPTTAIAITACWWLIQWMKKRFLTLSFGNQELILRSRTLALRWSLGMRLQCNDLQKFQYISYTLGSHRRSRRNRHATHATGYGSYVRCHPDICG